MTEFEIRPTTEQPTAAIRMTRPIRDIGEAMSEAFPRIYEAVVAAGVEPAGEPLARYFDMGPEVTTFECAVPVPEPFAGSGDVQPSTVGGGDAAFAVHTGPYDAISQTWERLMAWLTEQGRAPAGPFWERYIDDPQEVEASKLRTELYIPLR
jgi:effector-binding domain-containing protein